MGLIMVNLTNPVQEIKMEMSPAIWSKPMPLAWYFAGWLRVLTIENPICYDSFLLVLCRAVAAF